jgi:hypothetical protein
MNADRKQKVYLCSSVFIRGPSSCFELSSASLYAFGVAS